MCWGAFEHLLNWVVPWFVAAFFAGVLFLVTSDLEKEKQITRIGPGYDPEVGLKVVQFVVVLLIVVAMVAPLWNLRRRFHIASLLVGTLGVVVAGGFGETLPLEERAVTGLLVFSLSFAVGSLVMLTFEHRHCLSCGFVAKKEVGILRCPRCAEPYRSPRPKKR